MLDAKALVRLCAERFEPAGVDARRLLHGRGHTLPGFEQVTVDHFPPYLVVGLFREAARLPDEELQHLADALAQAFDGLQGIAIQRRDGRNTRTDVLFGDVPDALVAVEKGLRYRVRPLANQNVGLFLDMAPLRQRLASGCAGASVLNLFAYTCSLSVAALAGGARGVVNNDMSKPSLDVGRDNHQENGQDLRSVRMLPHNLFKSWWKIRQLGPYDIVIIDPPTNQRGSFVADKHYAQILKRLPEFAAPGARIYACLNSPFHNAEFLPGLMARWCPAATLEGRLPNSPDFPDVEADRALKVYEYVMR